MVAKIMPSAEFLRQSVDYDQETGRITWRIRPRDHFPTERGWKSGNGRTAGNPCGWEIKMNSGIVYLRASFAGRDILLHRIIWKWMTGNEPIDEIDHWDGNGLNNRWHNLREATHQQNQGNLKTRQGTKEPRGVYRHANRWVAGTNFNGKKVYLGTFATAEEAHQAYLDATQRLHAEYSFTQRPEPAVEKV